MTRLRATILWLLCTPCLPILWIMQIGQALAGSAERSINMATAIDQCGNALFGGDPDQTISARVGIAQLDGKPWAWFAASIIDTAFGDGHCLENANDWLKTHADPDERD